MTPEIGILGPCSVRSLADLLDARPEALPAGIVGTQILPMVRALVRRGTFVTVFTFAPEVDREQVFEGDGIRVSVSPYRVRGRARDFFAVERQGLVEAIARRPPALLHAHWTYEFAMAAQASGVPHVITAHDAPLRVLRYNPIPYRLMRTLMAAGVIRKARHLVAVSPYIADHLRRVFLFRGACEVIPTPVGDDLFASYDRPSGRPLRTFACVQNGWGRLKNVAVALQAFRSVRALHTDAELHLFGIDYGPGEVAERWATEHGLQAGVRFKGGRPQPALMDHLRREVDVVVHPSREESLGLGLVEAMALGIPVIAGRDSGAVPWTLEDGRVGILTDVTSAGSLAESMMAIVSDRDAAEELGRLGRESARRRFSAMPIVIAYENLYRRILEGGSTA